MSVTVKGFGTPFLRVTASILALLTVLVPAWEAAEAHHEASGAPDAGHPDEMNLSTASSLPEPAPGLRPALIAEDPSTDGAARRILRPPCH